MRRCGPGRTGRPHTRPGQSLFELGRHVRRPQRGVVDAPHLWCFGGGRQVTHQGDALLDLIGRGAHVGAFDELSSPVLKLSCRTDATLYRYYLEHLKFLLREGTHKLGDLDDIQGLDLDEVIA